MIDHAPLAVTGATGFVGRHFLDVAHAAGREVRALARAEQPPREGVTWIRGDLGDVAALDALTTGAGALIHIAGVINAPDAAGFEAGNVTGTEAVLAAARRQGVGRFVHVSSLAAREPGLSVYGASKLRSEALVRDTPLEWSIVRPPAVYGPADTATLSLFKMARSGWVFLPPSGKLSVIHAADLSRLLLALADNPRPSLLEPDDGRTGGWDHIAFAHALGQAVRRRVTPIRLPRWAMTAAAAADTGWSALRRRRPALSFDRAAYMCQGVHTPASRSPSLMTTMTGKRH